MKKFQISTRRTGKKRQINVIVYDDVKRMREHATLWTKRVQGKADDFSDCEGVTHREEWIDVKTDESMPYCGTIRLHKGRLGVGIVAHEVTHAALWIYELDIERNGVNTVDIGKEEIFCYIVSDLNTKLVNKLYDYGFYD